MERLTIRQKEIYDAIVQTKGDTSLSKIAKIVKSKISRQAVHQRIRQILVKGYLTQESGKYVPTPEGLEKLIKDGGKTKHSFYDKTENWEKTLRPDGFSQAVETTEQPQ